MKFTYTVAALVAAAASVQAGETNAHRMARGLSPLPPRDIRAHPSRTDSKFMRCHLPFSAQPALAPPLRSNFCCFHSVVNPSVISHAHLRFFLWHLTDAKRSSPSGTPPQGSGSCTTGPVHCCNSVEKANDSVVSTILGLLDLVLDPDVLVGLQCSPITAVGVGSGNSCSAHTVCCENNSQGGLISIGCIPIFL
ncbi:hydrophobin-domain-containing protein [Lentinus tigrinus ALCF2SS1-7]|uniref:hydrophobin-domain-containing protein n=1 Tax=Lentinus tigrinus ALCF2SS1-7 TaxID=1328758 RepID=UPI001165F664|nr:hydrophobin-domain-containing protein [Lentinus tigrinus ALCF2SS1-7]